MNVPNEFFIKPPIEGTKRLFLYPLFRENIYLEWQEIWKKRRVGLDSIFYELFEYNIAGPNQSFPLLIWAELRPLMRQKTSFFEFFVFSSARSKMLVRPTYCFLFSFLLPKQYLTIIGCICTFYCQAELGRKMRLKLWKMAVSEKDSNFHFWNIGQFQMPIRPKEHYRKRCTRWFSEPLRHTS